LPATKQYPQSASHRNGLASARTKEPRYWGAALPPDRVLRGKLVYPANP